MTVKLARSTAAAPGAPIPMPFTIDTGAWRGSVGLTLVTLLGFGFLYSLAGVGLGQPIRE